jgi:hypothetical protein
MGFQDPNSGAAAVVYLVLYVALLINSLVIIIKYVGWKTRFTALFVFCIIRIASQICGIGFATVSYGDFNWLIAYLVLGAEGYFVIVLSGFHFLCTFLERKLGETWLRPKLPAGLSKHQRLRTRLRSPAAIFHWMLIPANAILIAGGTRTVGVPPDQFSTSPIVKSGEIMRCVGQAIFLAMTQFYGLCALHAAVVLKLKGPLLYAVLLTWPILTVRGIYGILSAVDPAFNYYNFNNYTDTGLSSGFITVEYVMATTMEFLAATILLSQFWFDPEDWKRPGQQAAENQESDEQGFNLTDTSDKSKPVRESVEA